ncbi:DUF6065 family protein [Elongatibacter sediminis]|uniref:DUF6065 family protein n=1 Tax=Elongatibacter sediminis TaxID=3119006 RepID=A0AAW9RCA1_9GAMM
MHTIKAYVLPGAPDDAAQLIRPARPRRDWMNRTPDRYAYRCIPLSAANTMGWEILNPVNCEFRWNGLTPHTQLFVYREKELRFGPKSHFGSGVVTWELPFLFRTPPEYGLVVTGPANHDRADIAPLDGFIRTDWLPFPFTMNWRITRPDQTIRFEAGEPIARVFPYPLGLLEESGIELHDLAEDPDFERQFREWGARRQQNYRERERKAKTASPAENPDLDTLWNRQYARGAGSDEADQQHETVFRCRPVSDNRGDAN